MQVLLYDRTFDGFLTLIFETFDQHLEPGIIGNLESFQPILYGDIIQIQTDKAKAGRVWKGMKSRLTERAYNAVYRIHLADMEGDEVLMTLYRFLRKVFTTQGRIDENYNDPDVLRIKKLDHRVCKEAERMLQFVRFQKTADQIYFAMVDPDFNVIPLVVKHFENRFADQQWMIYDTKREYGIYFDGKETRIVTFDNPHFNKINGKVNPQALDEEEGLFQQLWKEYFKAICIEERRNELLQRQHMPRKYWKYLTEKQ